MSEEKEDWGGGGVGMGWGWERDLRVVLFFNGGLVMINRYAVKWIKLIWDKLS